MLQDDLGSLVAKLAADVTDLKRGLLEGRAELAGFQQMAVDAGAKVKQALTLVGVSVGIYEIVSQLKRLGSEILDIGGKSELLRVSAYAIASHYDMAAGSVDVYVQKLKGMGIEEDKALQSINNFLKAGVSIDLLPQLAQAAKDLAPSMGLFFNDAYAAIISSVTKGTPKALAELTPGIKSAMQAASSETKKLMDSTILSGTEKIQIMVDFVLQAAARMKDAGNDAASTYMRQLEAQKVAAKNAKEALFELVKPVALAITGAELQSWQDFYAWVGKNKQQLAELGELISIYVTKGFLGTKATIDFLYAHKDLVKVLLEVAAVMKVISWFTIAQGAGAAALAVGGLTGKLAALRLALSSPWALIITVSILGLMEALKDLDKLSKGRGRGAALAGEARGVMTPEQQAEIDQLNDVEQERIRPIREDLSKPNLSPGGQKKKEAQALSEAGDAGRKGQQENALPGGKGGKGAGGADDHLLRAMLSMLKAQRDAELGAAQNSLDLLKTTNDQKRAELEKSLAEGLIDGQAYYARLQELQQQETAGALDMIERKRQAQQKSYQDSLQELQADAKLSPEAKDLAARKLAAENIKALAKLDTEAAQARLEGEVKVTQELKRQVEVRKEYGRKTEDLNLETAQLLGAISEQEGKLQKLYLDWQRAKEDALKAGASPEYFRALEANYQAKVLDTSPWAEKMKAEGQILASALGDLAGSLWDNGLKFAQACDQLGKKVLKDTFKLFFDDLSKALTQGIKSLGSSISQEMQGAGGGFGGFFAGIGKWFSSLFGGGGANFPVSPEISSAHGNVIAGGVRLAAFGNGGIFTRPTIFPMAHGYGLAGEAGAEGILPLERIGGDLGVKALFPRPGPIQVTVVNNTGTAAKPTARQGDNGDLEIILDQANAQAAARGSKLTQVLEARYNLTKRF